VGASHGSLTVRRERQGRAREMTVVYAVMVAIVVLLILQFLLLMIGVENYLGGKRSVLAPAAVGSGFCFMAACWLIGQASRRRD